MDCLKPENVTKTLEFHEVEVKFRVDEGKLNDWKQLASTLKDKEGFSFKEFLYIESEDIYYVNKIKTEDSDYQFIRHRFSTNKKDKRAELTSKTKLKNSNNVIRKEWNIRVDNNEIETIKAWVEGGLGYEYNFKIVKYVSIYKFADATLPFYTVIDETGKRQSFIEIEVDEELLTKISEDQAWEIIKKYENELSSLGITPQKRLRLSLYEMYKK